MIDSPTVMSPTTLFFIHSFYLIVPESFFVLTRVLTMEISSSVSDEIAELRDAFPKVKIQTSTPSFLIASYQRTPHACIKFTLTFPEGYPDRPLILDINVDETVPPGLKKKLEKDLVCDIPIGLHQQVITVVNKLVQFVDINKFLPCWKELKQCINMMKNDNGNNGSGIRSGGASDSTISIIESKGKIKLKLCKRKYFYNCSITIDDGYPSTASNEDWGKPCDLKMISTNFPKKIENILTSQAQEVVRRMQDGMTSQNALIMSNPVPQPKNNEDDSKKTEVKERLTRDKLKNLKHDIDTLSTVRNLREKTASRVQGKDHVLKRHAKERKDARRAINKITDKEREADKLAAEREREWRSNETERMGGYALHDGSDPQPSLLALVTFLKNKIQYLPDAKCPCCQDLTLAPDPDKLQLLYASPSECKTEKEKKARKLARNLRPMRCYCGCWYHYQCLDKFMTEPPFGAACPKKGCGRRVFHPDWCDDMKELEKAWARQQARIREVQDATMFL